MLILFSEMRDVSSFDVLSISLFNASICLHCQQSLLNKIAVLNTNMKIGVLINMESDNDQENHKCDRNE